jgi:hypothetical protein
MTGPTSFASRASSQRATAFAALLLLASVAGLDAQQRQTASSDEQADARVAVLQAEEYLTPPQPVLDAVLAAAVDDLELENLDPSGRYFVRAIDNGFPGSPASRSGTTTLDSSRSIRPRTGTAV